MPWPQTATLQVSGAALATLALAAVSGFDFPRWSAAANVASVAYLVVVMTVVNFLAFNLALASIRAAWVSLYTALIPVVGAIAAVLVLGTPLSSSEMVGLAVISAGVSLPHVLRAREARPVKARRDG